MCRSQAGLSFPIHCLNGASRRKALRREAYNRLLTLSFSHIID
jgi:hypothetical protein